MRKIIPTLFLIILSIGAIVAQVPTGINFQGVARADDGTAIANEAVEVSISILDNTDGTIRYVETHNLTTDAAGLFSLVIGSGDLVSGDYDGLEWSILKDVSVGIDIASDGTVDIEFTTPFHSVPYANYAKFAENVDDADADPSNEIQTLSINGNILSLSGGGSISIPTGGTDADSDPQNELQTITLNGNVITLSDGGTITLPSDQVEDADASPTNELQELSINGDQLSISNGNTVQLSQSSVIVGTQSTDVPMAPAAGQLYFDETSNRFFIYHAEGWTEISLGSTITDIYGTANLDSDNDGINDSSDNCPNVPNSDQSNIDGDSEGDVCDSDIDGDGIANANDDCPEDYNPNQEDLDMDGCEDGNSNGLHPAFAEFDPGSYTIYMDGDDVVIETDGLPNHTSPYWSNTTERCLDGPMGMTLCTNENTTVDHPLFSAPTVTNFEQMAPGNIDDFNGSYTLRVPASPQLASSPSATGLGAIGMAISGSVIYNDEEGPNVPLDNAVGSLDYTAAHTGPQSYHYHLETKAWSEDDGELIGIISDGFFIYGRRDHDGTYPTDLDASGGHFGPTPHNPAGEYHYHIQNELYLGQYYILFPGDYQGTPNNIR